MFCRLDSSKGLLFSSTLFTLLLCSLTLPVLGASVKSVRRGKAIVKGLPGEFRKGDLVSTYTPSGRLAARGRVAKTKGRHYYLVRTAGVFKKGQRARLSRGLASRHKRGDGVRSVVEKLFNTRDYRFGGTAFLGAAGPGLGFGVDGSWGAKKTGLRYHLGFGYWSNRSEVGVNLLAQSIQNRAFELTAGAEYGHQVASVVISGGLRVGYGSHAFRSEFLETIQSNEASEFSNGGLVLSPVASFEYLLGQGMRAGLQLRHTTAFFNFENDLGSYIRFSALATFSIVLR